MLPRAGDTQHTCGLTTRLPCILSQTGVRWRAEPKIRSGNKQTAICCSSRRYPGSSGRKLRNATCCQAQDTETETSTSEETKAEEQAHVSPSPEPAQAPVESQEERDRIATTLRGLDALLGIEEEVIKEEAKKDSRKDMPAKSAVEIDDSVLRTLAESQVTRDGKKDDEYEKAVQDALTKMKDVYAAANKVRRSTEGSQDPTETLRKEMEKMMDMLEPGTKGDITAIKEKVFGPQLFWVTEAKPEIGKLPGAYLIRGNLRCPQQEAFDRVTEGVQKLFGDKYSVFLIPDPERLELSTGQQPQQRERAAFRIVPSKYAVPAQAPGWQVAIAVLLLVFAAGTSFQTGLVANTATLPQNILRALQTADALDPETIPYEIANYDFMPYLLSALPIAGSIMGVQLLHELGHRLAANARNVKLGVPLFVPNGQIGLFGAVTQFKSLIKTRTAHLDVAAAGPALGCLASAALFLAGLTLSRGASQEGLLPIPNALLNDSLLLGGITKATLGPSGAQSLFVHPYVIGGWCGLVATALNCLPVGCLDGGRIMQAAFGKRSLTISSIFTYVALVTGLLGNTLSFPFALYIFICQRDASDVTQDTITPPNGLRKGFALSLILVSLLILLPLATGGDPTNPPSISL